MVLDRIPSIRDLSVASWLDYTINGLIVGNVYALVAVGLAKKKRKDSRLVHGLPKPIGVTNDPQSQTVLDAVGNEPRHMDELVLRSALPTSAVATALLTLALENVVVEGPSGFFRRANPR